MQQGWEKTEAPVAKTKTSAGSPFKMTKGKQIDKSKLNAFCHAANDLHLEI